MTPDEFEQYLGLADGALPDTAGFDQQEFYYGTEPKRDCGVVDRILEAEQHLNGVDDSYSHQPIVSAHQKAEMIDGRSQNGPSSMFDSFD